MYHGIVSLMLNGAAARVQAAQASRLKTKDTPSDSLWGTIIVRYNSLRTRVYVMYPGVTYPRIARGGYPILLRSGYAAAAPESDCAVATACLADLKSAQQALRKTLSINPRNTEAMRALGSLFLQQGDLRVRAPKTLPKRSLAPSRQAALPALSYVREHARSVC